VPLAALVDALAGVPAAAPLANDSRVLVGDVRGDAARDARLPPTHVAARATSWPWRNPHSLAVDPRRGRLYVADRERPAGDALDLRSLDHVCTYSLAALGGGRAFTVVTTPPAPGDRGRLFALLARVPTNGSAVVELDPDDCGAVLGVHPVPLGGYPLHDLTVAPGEGGAATLVVAAVPAQAYELPARR
jgi:hypothetical protein